MHIDNNQISYEVANGATKLFHIQDLNMAIARIGEIQHVTSLKAPELLATFNKAWRDAAELYAAASLDHVEAIRKVGKVKAIILLDKAPGILKDKGLASARAPGGSEDFRQAVLDTDPDYTHAQEVSDKIECIMELLKGKQKAIEMAFTSVKKIMDDNKSYSYGVSAKDNLSAGDNTDANVGDEIYKQFGHSR